MAMEIGCALHNVRVCLTPSWMPMVQVVMNYILLVLCYQQLLSQT